MIKQTVAFNDILGKKFKILRTSILLGNLSNKEKTLSEYEDAARELEQIRREEYEEILASKKYTTTNLLDEKNRLEEIIAFIKNRVKERNDFVDDYIKVTANFLDNLPRVMDEDRLLEYTDRLSNIAEYLDNCDEINRINFLLRSLKDDLEEKYDNKSKSELINSKLEDELIDEFNKYIVNNEYYSSLNYSEIEEELVKLNDSIIDKEQVMNTFISSYQALISAGITGADREEYLSYVRDSKSDYYSDLERKYILNIYKLVLEKEENYEKLYHKRELIEDILLERNKMRKELEIILRNDIESFERLCQEQFNIIKSQKNNIDSIDKLIGEINENEVRLDELERANERRDIALILEEYSIPKVEIEKVEMPQEKAMVRYEDTSVIEGPKPSNMVVKIEDPIKINVKNATDTAKLVMKKVVIVLEPKKFGRDKLKEAEEEIKKEKLEQERLALEKELDEIIDKKEEEKDTVEEDVVDTGIFLDNSQEDSIFEDNSNKDKDTNNDDGAFINLEFENIFDNDNNIDNDNNSTEISDIEIPKDENDEFVIPTEIFLDTSKVEEHNDLFSVKDPFLDDNEFELMDKEAEETTRSTMPVVEKIGSVKPNSTLSKIEDVVKDNDDIILPTLGLNEEENKNIPIVSENYLNE